MESILVSALLGSFMIFSLNNEHTKFWGTVKCNSNESFTVALGESHHGDFFFNPSFFYIKF